MEGRDKLVDWQEVRAFAPPLDRAHPALAPPRSVPAPLSPQLTQNRLRPHRRLQLLIARHRPKLGHAIQEELDHGLLFLLAPVCLASGSILWLTAATDSPLYRLLLWCLVCFAALLWLPRERSVRRALALGGLLVALGALLSAFEDWRCQTVILDSPVTTTVTGRIVEREGAGEGTWRYLLAVEDTQAPHLYRAPSRVLLTARSEPSGLPVGATITGRARLSPPNGPALPGLDDFAMRAYFAGIGASGFFYGKPQRGQARLPARGDWPALAEWLAGLRSDIATRIRSQIPGDPGAFAASLVTDERRSISRETSEALRMAGLSHIVAISGLNMALSAGIFFVGLRKLLSLSPRLAHAYPIKKFAAFGAMIALSAYYLISGFAVSAERAFLMMAVMLMAVLIDRPSISLRNLAISAILILALSPSEITGASFQMSFAATAGLVSGSTLLLRRIESRDRLSHGLIHSGARALLLFALGIGATSLIGGLSTGLFAAAHFQRLTAYGLPANLLAMPIISFLVMPMGMLAMLLMPFGLDGPAWAPVGLGLDWVIAIAKEVAGWGGSLDTGRLPDWYFTTAVLALLILVLLRTWLRYAGGAVLLLATTAVFALPEQTLPDLVISEDAATVGRPTSGRIATNRTSPPLFLLEQWQHALRAPLHSPARPAEPVTERKGAKRKAKTEPDAARMARRAFLEDLKALPPEQFACRARRWCLLRTARGKTVATLSEPSLIGAACDHADVVIASRSVKTKTCRSGASLFTRDSLRRSGTVELRFLPTGPPAIVASIRSVDRPWNRHRSYDWRSRSYRADSKSAPAEEINDSDE